MPAEIAATPTRRHEAIAVPGPGTTINATFAFVDLAGFTALTETHGDLEAVKIVQQFRQRVVALLPPGGHLVKTVGDAVMLAFTDPAVAVATLHELLVVELDHQDAVLLPRAGANHGPAVVVDDDYYGTTINIAARVAATAQPGQLLGTSEVARAARDAGLIVTDRGPHELRNVARRIELYEIHTCHEAAVAVDPICHMRVPTSGPDAITLRYAEHDVHFCGFACVSRFTDDSMKAR